MKNGQNPDVRSSKKQKIDVEDEDDSDEQKRLRLGRRNYLQKNLWDERLLGGCYHKGQPFRFGNL